VSYTTPIIPPSSPSLQHHLPGGCPGDCDLQLHSWHRWILGRGNLVHDTTTTRLSSVGSTLAGWGSMPVFFSPGMAGHPCPTLRAKFLSIQGDPANIGKGCSRPARCTRGPGDRFGIPKPRESGSVIGADRRRSGPSCVLPEGVPQGQTGVGV